MTLKHVSRDADDAQLRKAGGQGPDDGSEPSAPVSGQTPRQLRAERQRGIDDDLLEKRKKRTHTMETAALSAVFLFTSMSGWIVLGLPLPYYTATDSNVEAAQYFLALVAGGIISRVLKQ